MNGSQNSHKIPVFEGIDLEWIDMQMKNTDMEFQTWVEFLMVMFCAVYTIDPSELGFNFQQAHQMFGQDGQKQRLQHSRDKGLKPLLMFVQKVISKFIVSELNPEFEFMPWFFGMLRLHLSSDIRHRSTAVDARGDDLRGLTENCIGHS